MNTETSKLSLENAIGSKLAVWVGAIALALGGVFLVKYSIDQGWLGAELRVLGGLLLGGALGGVSWRLRERSNYVSQGLAAAAVICLYATFWAATDLYELIPPVLGLGGMVVTTVLAVAGALRLGPLVAIIGMLGAFLAPLLVGQREPEPIGLFAYLLALQAGSHFVARRRRWVWASAISMAAGALWVLAHLISGSGGEFWPGLFLLGSTFVFTLPELLKPDAGRGSMIAVWVAGALGASLLGLHLGLSGFQPTVWVFYGILAAGTGALAIWQRRYALLPWMTFAVALVPALIQVGSGAWTPAENVYLLLGLAGLFLTIGFAGMWREPSESSRLLATVAPAAFLLPALVHYGDLIDSHGEYAWLGVALTVGGLYALYAAIAVAGRARLHKGSLSALIVPAFAYTAIAWPLGLEIQWCVLLWSAQMVMAAGIDRVLRLGALQVTSGVLMSGIALSLLSPIVLLMHDSVGEWPVLNLLTVTYLGAVAAALATRFLTKDQAELRALYLIAATLLGMAGAGLNVHHFTNGGDLLGTSFPALEITAWVVIALVASIGFLLRIPGHGEETDVEQLILQRFARGLAMTSLIAGVLLTFTLGNPWVRHHEVHGVILFNTVLVGIGLPTLLSGIAAGLLGERGYPQDRQAAWWFTGYLIVLLVMVQVRHAFHGSELWVGEVVNAESYCYSLAIALLSLLALGIGIYRGSKTLRLVALSGMAVCSLKVFLWDMRELQDIFRVLSFLGLGGSLMALGYVYNRFVPKLPQRKEAVEEEVLSDLS